MADARTSENNLTKTSRDLVFGVGGDFDVSRMAIPVTVCCNVNNYGLVVLQDYLPCSRISFIGLLEIILVCGEVGGPKATLIVNRTTRGYIFAF